MQQDKQLEIAFFDQHATQQDYNVFTDRANTKIIQTALSCLKAPPGAHIVDLGCGSGIFTQLVKAKGYHCVGLDLSHKLLTLGKQQQDIPYLQGDVEFLPFKSQSLDYVMLSCLVHHLPDPSRCAKELFRVLKPGGRFVAFDPNRLNPFMYLYRDKSSPFYSSEGVTPNERPVLAKAVRQLFEQAGFKATSQYVDGLSYRFIASNTASKLLPVYNFIDRWCFRLPLLAPMRAFVFTHGQKP